MASDREKCLAAGMDGYLSKPIDPSALFAAVEGGGAIVASPAFAGGAAVFDEAALRHRVSDDDELMHSVIQLFLEDLPARLAAIKDALTSAEALRAAAHALKGAAANLSADRLCEAARALERTAIDGRLESAGGEWLRVEQEAAAVRDRLSPSTPKEPLSCAS
jgi:HPt (histidine-containing phosphotransfer) domain-containing protein